MTTEKKNHKCAFPVDFTLWFVLMFGVTVINFINIILPYLTKGASHDSILRLLPFILDINNHNTVTVPPTQGFGHKDVKGVGLK